MPQLKGGTRLGATRLHQICHSAIHVNAYDKNQKSPARCLAWVRTKPDGSHARTQRAKSHTQKWRP